MYIESIHNRDSPPAVLLRESYREDGKVCKRTLANLSCLSTEVVEGLKVLLRGGVAVASASELFSVERSLPHGHVAAVQGSARGCGGPQSGSARLLRRCSHCCSGPPHRAGLQAGYGPPTARPDGQLLAGACAECGPVQADELNRALDWLHEAQPDIERRLARRHLAGATLVLYDLTSTWLTGRCCELAARGYSRDAFKPKPSNCSHSTGLVPCSHTHCKRKVQAGRGLMSRRGPKFGLGAGTLALRRAACKALEGTHRRPTKPYVVFSRLMFRCCPRALAEKAKKKRAEARFSL